MAASPAPRKMALLRKSSAVIAPAPPYGDARVSRADGYHAWRSTHPLQEFWREKHTRQPDDEGDHEAEHDRLHCGDGCAFGIFFADAARDHRGCGHREAEADGEDEAQHRLGQTDRCDGVCA